MTEILLADVRRFYGLDDTRVQILGLPRQLQVASISRQSLEGVFCFAKSKARLADVTISKSIIVCGSEQNAVSCDDETSSLFILTTSPREEYFRCVAAFCSKSVLDDKQFIGTNSGALVHESAIISPDATLGENTVVHPNCVIYGNVVIAENCTIGPGTVVGYSGFGVIKDRQGQNIKIPHLGGVRIDARCNIGALNTICSGTLDPTVVGAGTCTDDHVHIAHNVQIGENCILTACVELSGSVSLGNDVWIGPNASVRNGLRIGDNALIGIGSNIVKDVAPNATVAGNPGKVF